MNYVFVKQLSKAQLAKVYDVTLRIFKNWLAPFREEVGEPRGRYYTPKQVRMIFQRVGYPHPDKLKEISQ